MLIFTFLSTNDNILLMNIPHDPEKFYSKTFYLFLFYIRGVQFFSWESDQGLQVQWKVAGSCESNLNPCVR